MGSHEARLPIETSDAPKALLWRQRDGFLFICERVRAYTLKPCKPERSWGRITSVKELRYSLLNSGQSLVPCNIMCNRAVPDARVSVGKAMKEKPMIRARDSVLADAASSRQNAL